LDLGGWHDGIVSIIGSRGCSIVQGANRCGILKLVSPATAVNLAEEPVTGHGESADDQNADQPDQHRHEDGNHLNNVSRSTTALPSDSWLSNAIETPHQVNMAFIVAANNHAPNKYQTSVGSLLPSRV
jgi:hypothetical protein